MKKIIFLFAFIALAPQAYAKTTTTVKVNNNVSTSGNNTSTVENDITIETNGKVTHYSSDKPENIEIKSEDGVSEIKVNGEKVTPGINDNEVSVSPTSTDEPEDDNENEQDDDKNLLERLGKIIKKLFFFWN